MKITIKILLFLTFFSPILASAEMIELKTGKVLEGKIINQNEDFIKIDFGVGVLTTLYIDEIKSIDGEPVTSLENSSETSADLTVDVIEDELQSEPRKTIDVFSKDKRFQIKSGMIKYKVNTSNIEGIRISYFDDYGDKFHYVEEFQSQMYILNDGVSYMIDLDKKTAIKTIESDWGKKDMVNAIKKNMPDADNAFANQYASSVFNEKEVLGTEVILGRECEIVDVGFNNSCLYKGVTLKSDSEYASANKLVAIEFEENVMIPVDKFELPNDIEITGEVNHRDMMEGFFGAPAK